MGLSEVHEIHFSFFPLQLRKTKMMKFINLKQGNLSVKEYAVKFTKISKYSPSLVANPYGRIRKFMSRVSNLVVKQCQTVMLVKEMDISQLITYTKQIKEEKLKEGARIAKKARVKDGLSLLMLQCLRIKGKDTYIPFFENVVGYIKGVRVVAINVMRLGKRGEIAC